MNEKMPSPKPVSRCAECGKPLQHIRLQVTAVLCVQCYDERRYRKEPARFAQGSSTENLA